MKITKRAVFILLAAFLLFLIVLAPATLISKFIPENSPVALNGLSGSIWRGQASQLQHQGKNLGKLNWRLSPRNLITGKIGGRFELDGQQMRADGHAKVNKNNDLWLSDTNVRMNADAIPLTGSAAALQAEGVINAKIDTLVLLDKQLDTIDARIAWQKANIQAPIELDIGDLVIDATGENGAAKAVITTAQNSSIDINGNVDLNSNGSYRANIKVRAKSNTPENISNYLTLLGEEESDGARRIIYEGELVQ